MIKYRAFIIIFICLVYFSKIYAQQICGHVVDKHGNAIVAASVFVYADTTENAQIIAFISTDNKGDFCMDKNVVDRNSWLIVRSLGYQKFVTKTNSENHFYNITLEEDKRSLKEVIVKARYSGIRTIGDTVKYDVKHFTNGFETNVADVLKSLPGIKVDKGGQVSYGGQSIGKLLIDGKDMFSDENRGLVIKNMSAQMVTGAEIIKNYNDDNHEKDNTFTKLALNLRTKGFRKFCGYIESDGGYNEKFNIKTFDIFNQDRLTINPLVVSNNMGHPAFTINDYINRRLMVTDNENLNIKMTGAETGLLYRPDNVFSDISHFGVVDTKYNSLNGKLTLTSNIIINKADVKEKHTIQNEYLSSLIIDTLMYESRAITNLAVASIRAIWKSTERLQLIPYINLNISKANTEKSSISSNKESNYYDKSQNKCEEFGGGMRVFFKNKKHTISAILNSSYYDNNNNYDLTTGMNILPIEYYSVSNMMYSAGELVSSKRIGVSASLKYDYKLKENYKLIAMASFQSKKYINSGSFLAKEVLPKESFKTNESLFDISIKKDKGNFLYMIGGTLRYEDNSCIKKLKNKSIFIYPKFQMEYAFTTMQKLSFTINKGQSLVDEEKLYSFERIKSYNEIEKGCIVSTPYQNETKIGLSYFNYDTNHQLYFTLFSNATFTKNALKRNVQQKGIVNIISYSNDGHEKNFYAIASIEKRFVFPLIVKSNLSYNHIQTNVLLNDVNSKSVNSQSLFDMNVSTSFPAHLNGNVMFKYRYNYNNVYSIKNNTHEILTECRILYRWGLLRSELSWGIQLIQGNNMEEYVQQIVSSKISLKLKHITVRFSANNLFNLRNSEWIRKTVTPYLTVNDIYQRLPGSLTVGVTWAY